MTNSAELPVSISATTRLPRVVRGSGSYLYDATGKQYIDGSGGPVVYCIGHGNAEVNAAITAQLGQIAHGYRYNFTTDALEELTAIIRQNAGGTLTEMVFVSGGSEAVESCLKMALQYQTAIGRKSRRRFISRRRSWHGNTLGALSVSDFAERTAAFEGALIPGIKVSTANVYRPIAGATAQTVGAACADELEATILLPENFYLSGNATFSQNKVLYYNEFIDDYDQGTQVKNSYKKADIAFSPSVIAAGRLEWKGIKGLSLLIQSKYIGKQFLDNTSNEGRAIQAYTTVDFIGGYSIKLPFMKEISFRLMLNNLLDAKYVSNGYTYSYISGGSQQTFNYYYPQAGRNFLAGVSLKF